MTHQCLICYDKLWNLSPMDIRSQGTSTGTRRSGSSISTSVNGKRSGGRKRTSTSSNSNVSDSTGQAVDVVVTRCGHMYHRPCINNWLKQKRTCPKCQSRVGSTNLIQLYPDQFQAEETGNGPTATTSGGHPSTSPPHQGPGSGSRKRPFTEVESEAEIWQRFGPITDKIPKLSLPSSGKKVKPKDFKEFLQSHNAIVAEYNVMSQKFMEAIEEITVSEGVIASLTATTTAAADGSGGGGPSPSQNANGEIVGDGGHDGGPYVHENDDPEEIMIVDSSMDTSDYSDDSLIWESYDSDDLE